MAYVVQQDKTCFNVVEKSSDLIIATRKVKTAATAICRALNLGAGFDGHTPTFFTTVYPKLENN